MSNTTNINKKGQYYPQQRYASVHPILIIGIAFFVIPFLTPIFGWNMHNYTSNFFTWAGLILIMVGAAFSIFNISN